MNATRVIMVSVALSIVAIFWMISSSSTVRASADPDKDNIVALNQRLIDSFNKRDLAGVTSCYMSGEDLVFFEDTTPLQFKGTGALHTYLQDFIDSSSRIHAEMEAVSIVVSGDLAAVHYVMPFSWTDKSGSYSERARYTQVLKRTNGRWLIWHEHFSVPYYPTSGKAMLSAKP